MAVRSSSLGSTPVSQIMRPSLSTGSWASTAMAKSTWARKPSSRGTYSPSPACRCKDMSTNTSGVRRERAVRDCAAGVDGALSCKAEHKLGVVDLGLDNADRLVALDQDGEQPFGRRVHGRDDLWLAELVAHLEDGAQLVGVTYDVSFLDHLLEVGILQRLRHAVQRLGRLPVAVEQLLGVLAGQVDEPLAVPDRRLVVLAAELPAVRAGPLARVSTRCEREGDSRLLGRQLCGPWQQRYVGEVLLDAHDECGRGVVDDAGRAHLILQKLGERRGGRSETDVKAGRAVGGERTAALLEGLLQRCALLIGHAADGEHVVVGRPVPVRTRLGRPRDVPEVECRRVRTAVLVAVVVLNEQRINHGWVLGVDLPHARECQVAPVACGGRDAHDPHRPILLQRLVNPCGALHLALGRDHVEHVFYCEKLLAQLLRRPDALTRIGVHLVHDVQVQRVGRRVRVWLKVQAGRFGPARSRGERKGLSLHVLDELDSLIELVGSAALAQHEHVELVPTQIVLEQKKAVPLGQRHAAQLAQLLRQLRGSRRNLRRGAAFEGLAIG
eukprot:scaffold50_cov107-Isochrysis_galbana.AAC.7